MRRVALYSSVLYGEDFIVESIESILPYVERIFVVLMERPWGRTRGVFYRGQWIDWPERFDDTALRVGKLSTKAPVTILRTQKDTPWNRWGYGLSVVRQHYSAAFDEVLVIDPDCVFSTEEAKKMFDDWEMHSEYVWGAPDHIELWRTPAYQAVCPPRNMVWLCRDPATLAFPDPPGSHSTVLPKMNQLHAEVHNLGFCFSEQTMRWKHLTALAFSPVVKESMPRENWFEDVWRIWKPGDQNLGISERCESSIREAVQYDVAKLPKSIRIRYENGEWPRW